MTALSPTKPDYAWWVARPLWTLYEAACLLSDIEPVPHEDKTKLPAALTSGRPKERYADLKSAVIDLHEIQYKQRLAGDPLFMYRMKPHECIRWAVNRSYPVANELLDAVSNAAHVSTHEIEMTNTSKQQLSKQRLQEQTILEYLTSKGYDPTQLKKWTVNTAGPKADVKSAMLENKKLFSDKSFELAWERLSSAKRISYME